MLTAVTILYATLELSVSSVFFNKKHFNPISGHFLKMFQYIGRCSTPPHRWGRVVESYRKWPPIGLKCFLLNDTEETGNSS